MWITHGHLALPPPTSERGYNIQYPAIHWLNDDILFGIFNCYRLDNQYHWNYRIGWRKLSHVCQRWRHLVYKSAFLLGMHIECTNGSPVVDTLDHLPPLPLLINYRHTMFDVATVTEQDEQGIYHSLRLHDRVYHINLELPPFILHNVFVILDGQFPMLEDLSLTSSDISISLLPTLPKAFLAPNLRHLTLPSISPPRRLQFLTSTVSLVKLDISEIQTSSYFRPRLLVARLSSLPQLKEMSIGFSIPIPRPSTERALLGEEGAPVTLPSLKCLRFNGVGGYLESLVAQIRAPLLERLSITLFNQIAFALPHLFYLINSTKAFMLPNATVLLGGKKVSVTVKPSISESAWSTKSFRLSVICEPLDWQIDCAAQICHALMPTLSCVELTLYLDYQGIPTELQHGSIDSATWHDLLRSFTGVKMLCINNRFLEELSRALRVDEVGSDPGFLPNLQSIGAKDNLFASFIDTRRIVGRPVQFVRW